MRHLSPIRHPYLFGGGISGALIAFAVAAFISMTAVVSQTQLPGGPQSLLTSHPGTLTISGGAGIAQAGTAAETGTSTTAGAGSALGAPASALPPGTLLGTGPLTGGAGGFTASPPTAPGTPGAASDRANGPGNRPGNGNSGPGPNSGTPQPGFLAPGQGVNELAKGTAVPTFLSSSPDSGRQRCGA